MPLVALAAVVFARPERSGAPDVHVRVRHRRPTRQRFGDARGGRAAARALGVRYILAGTGHNGSDQELIHVYRSMIARHVDAIVSQGYDLR